MAVQYGKEKKAKVLLISEPNKIAIAGRKDLVYDNDFDTAIKVLDGKMVIEDYGRGSGFSYIETGGVTIYSCYSSGNKKVEYLESTLGEIAERIRINKESAIVAGDFNAKSPLWGMTYTDTRGQAVAEWVAENELVVLNQGDKPTYLARGCSSVLDLTFATEDVSRKVEHWRVGYEESMSDHRYIIFKIMQEKRDNTPKKKEYTGWVVSKLNRQKLSQIASEIVINNDTISVDGFANVLKELCNKTMPKRMIIPGKKSAYWWNDEIAKLRVDCNKARRIYTRSVKKGIEITIMEKWLIYLKAKKSLRSSIRKAKKACWKTVCEEVDEDVWGNGYKIVMKRMTGFPPKPELTMSFLEEVVDHLFPKHEPVIFDLRKNVHVEPCTQAELVTACERLKNKKAPGPDGIPAEILKVVITANPEYLLAVYNALLREAIFPERWKIAKLVLLKKGDKPQKSPSSYRPICLLDAEGKLYEQLILERLNQELKRTGGLSSNQYGFRKGRQTTDAVSEVIRVARMAGKYASRNKKLCAIVTLDVRNAFNSASWQEILLELRRRGIEEGLISLIGSYLSQRRIIIEAEGNSATISTSSGVPQGSILGPTLWNVLYDPILRMKFPENIRLVGYADDLLLIVIARMEEILMNTTNAAMQMILNELQNRGLQLAPEKTEALVVTQRRNLRPIWFTIQDVKIEPSPAIKYLGTYLDKKLNFARQVNETAEKATKTAKALMSIMPNIGGPRASKRALLSSVVHSQLLYAAPVWSEAAKRQKQARILTKVQRLMTIRVCSAYRTISAVGAAVISGTPPILLMIEEREENYRCKDPENARKNLMEKWQKQWETAEHARWTYELIPLIGEWISRKHGEIDYFMTQALSGHGCFSKFLHGRKKAESDKCMYCGKIDDARHTIFECDRWNRERESFEQETESPFTPRHMMENLLKSEQHWDTTYKTIRSIIQKKEEEYRKYTSQ